MVLASFQIATSRFIRHTVCVRKRSGPNPDPWDSEPSALQFSVKHYIVFQDLYSIIKILKIKVSRISNLKPFRSHLQGVLLP